MKTAWLMARPGAAIGSTSATPSAPLTVNYERELFELEVEQVTMPIKGIVTKETVMAETTLGEMTAANLRLAFGGTVTTTAAAVGQVAMEELEAGGATTLPVYAWGFEGLYQTDAGAQYPVRVFIWRGSAVLNGGLEFSKKAAVGIPLQITAWADTTKVVGEADSSRFRRSPGRPHRSRRCRKRSRSSWAGRATSSTLCPSRHRKPGGRKLAGPFGQFAATLEHAGEIDLTNGGALSNLIQVVSDTLLGSIDLLQDLLFAYSPALRADRERIEATAYDEEAMTALIEVLKLAYPFGAVLSLVSGATKKPIT